MKNFICDLFYYLGCINGHVIGISKVIKMQIKIATIDMKRKIIMRRIKRLDKRYKLVCKLESE